MLLDGEWAAGTLKGDKVAFPYDWLLLPPVNGSTERNKLSLFVGDTIGIPTKAQNPAAALNFAELVSSPKGQYCDLAADELPSIKKMCIRDRLELDFLSRLVRRQGRPLALSAKELAVLEALIAASPGYLSAEQLLEEAWDENADPFTKTVPVTIGRLRRKLGEPQVIETTVGVGYRLVGPCLLYTSPTPRRPH